LAFVFGVVACGCGGESDRRADPTDGPLDDDDAIVHLDSM
jgi:hypothetical protein